MYIRSRTGCSPGEWDAVCDRSADAWLFHRWRWVEIEKEFGCSADHSFAVLGANRDIRAIFPLYEYRLGLGDWVETLLASGHPRQSGPAFHPEMDESERKAVQSVLMNHLFELAAKIDADRIQLGVQSLTPRWRNAARFDIPFWLQDRRFERGPAYSPSGQALCPGLYSLALEQIVVLQKPVEALREDLSSACRRAIRKAGEAGLEASVGHGRNAVGEFYQLALKSSARTGEQLPAIAYYEKIDAFFASTNNARIIFVHNKGQVVAALLVVVDKNVMSFLAGVSDSEKHHLRPNDLLHWTAILWARENGLELYRLGMYLPQIFPDSPVGRVTRFKARFSNRQYEALTASHYRNIGKYRSLGHRYIDDRCRDPSGGE